MAKVIKKATAEEVIKYFKSVNRNAGNAPLEATIRQSSDWNLCKLTKEELLTLECQIEPHKLLKDINYEDFVKTRPDVVGKLKQLIGQQYANPLIARSGLPTNPLMTGASFYLEDGTGTSIAIKKYLETKTYSRILAFIGKYE